ncbi:MULTISPECIES: ATP-binding protein [unclassified Streptomyces]|uniref:ATP-binding protein n=1 Tax=unclassified Streptomyces TaxID=2593676 RepID=UPI000DABB695|nr:MULTISPECIES: ATP-binding protein [unclassified Streptomyces]PZT71606.1 ATP-binding protein [Streptomyces sp. AC1-42T]PZT73267.1 ATP-binding protein [Streptomyces sp. AC1-42W]
MLTDQTAQTSAAAQGAPLAATAAPQYLHFLNLAGARTVLTPGLAAAENALDGAYRQRRFLCVLGDAGVGKTFVVHHAAHTRFPQAHLPLHLGARPTPADLRAHLHHALGLPGAAPAAPAVADTLIRRALAATPRIVVVDEADRMSEACFEYLRFLHDDIPGGLCTVLIAGQHGEKALRAQQMLHTRTAEWLTLQPLTHDQIPRAIPALHPLWQAAAPDQLCFLDGHFAHGRLRRWALLTHHVQRALVSTGAAHPGPGLLRQITRRIDTSHRP